MKSLLVVSILAAILLLSVDHPAPRADAQSAPGAVYEGMTEAGDHLTLTVSADGRRLLMFAAERLVIPTALPAVTFTLPAVRVGDDLSAPIVDAAFELDLPIAAAAPPADRPVDSTLRVSGTFIAPGRVEGELALLAGPLDSGSVRWRASVSLAEAASEEVIPIPAARSLPAGQRVTFVDVRQPPPPLRAEPVFVDVSNDGGEIAAVHYDGATLTIAAPDGFLIRVSQGCRIALDPAALVACPVAGSFLRGRVRVEFTVEPAAPFAHATKPTSPP